ncbi:MAG: hypothetical protein KQH83_02245 [Actinobacteria bacterium]|nr:hypothetical protein [Actinomycetota bacterium]
MSSSRTETFPAHPATVFEALLDAADGESRYRVHVVSARDLQAFVIRPGKSWRLSASVTDNGYGEALLHLSWEPRTSGGAGKCARRLVKGICATLADMEAPPPAPPR